MKSNPEQIRKKKKLLLVLPLLSLPFITLIFWAFGGGKVTGADDKELHQGINTELPDAKLQSGETLDKMSLYGKFRVDTSEDSQLTESEDSLYEGQGSHLADYAPQNPYGMGQYENDPNETRVMQRLEELERIINHSQENTPAFGEQYGNYTNEPDTDASLKRLELLMEQMSGSSEPDPELQAIDGMLEKIIDIQHPERLKEKSRELSLEKKGMAFPVHRTGKSVDVPLVRRSLPIANIQNEEEETFPVENHNFNRRGFHTLKIQGNAEIQEMAGIPATIHETQTIISGSNIKMRLLEDIYVSGILIPAGHFVSGECSLDGERLQITVSGIQSGNYQLPVSLTVYDRDGMAGIRIPGAITRDAAKDGTDRAIQSMQIMSGMDPSIWGQAAGAGVEAVKGLFSKKAKLVKVTVKAGHPVLLFDERSNKL